jgi:hypothetical protein
MKTYNVKMSYYQYYYATVQAKDFDQATEKAKALGIEDCKLDDYVEWEVYSIEEKVPRSLTAEEQAFLEAYLNCVAIAEREDVERFLRADSEERSSNAFYDSMSDVYSSICDAKEVWYAAMQFAKETTK